MFSGAQAVLSASIPVQAMRDKIEAFLAVQCNPLVGERFPDRTPIAVNLPV